MDNTKSAGITRNTVTVVAIVSTAIVTLVMIAALWHAGTIGTQEFHETARACIAAGGQIISGQCVRG